MSRGPVDGERLLPAAQRLRDAGAGTAIVTRGGEPALVLDGERAHELVRPNIEGRATLDRVARLSDYRFGRIVVDGTEHDRDLIVLPGRVVAGWWRRDGHSLVPEDLDEVIDELPERLVVGCGAHGRLRPHPSVLEALARRGVAVEALPTGEAVERYGELDPARTAAALHLTC